MNKVAERLRNLREVELSNKIFALLYNDEVGVDIIYREFGEQGFTQSAARKLIQEAQDDVRI